MTRLNDQAKEVNQMTMVLDSMAVEMPLVEGHPNRAGFRGVLTVVDVASQRAPSGSRGHRVVLTRAAAEAALPSLLGMALDYAPTFDRHDQRRKVGVITSAEIVGRNLEIGGYLYAKDFPDIVEEIEKWGRRRPGDNGSSVLRKVRHGATGKARRLQEVQAAVQPSQSDGEGAMLRARLASAVDRIRGLVGRRVVRREDETDLRAEAAGQLGMSYEVADVMLADVRSRVWILTRVTFTGAAILRRDKAAYEDTWIELTA
jgi:hypothetical protein